MEAGESARFDAVVLPHLDAAYTLARYLARNGPDADDVVQEACLRALRYFDGFRGEEGQSARAWFLAIVRHTAYTWRRRGRAETLATEFDETQHSGAIADEHPEAALVRSGAKEALGRALEQLPAEFREVIVLRELQNLSYKEIEERCGRARRTGQVPVFPRPRAAPAGAA